MSSTQHDARILYSINNIRAFHVQNGEETELTPSSPQTLSLLMVPTTSPYDEISLDGNGGTAEEDFYLHLHLPPELDMPLPATTQIYHQPPNSYLIPRWDLGPDVGAFIRLQFPGIGNGPNKVTQEDVDTFETILAQCTAFLERAKPPSTPKTYSTYNPADYAPGEGYISSPGVGPRPGNSHGQIVLVDEQDGSVVGELTGGYQVVEKPGVKPGSKNPVEIQLPTEGEGNRISISNVSEEYLSISRHPAYKNSTIVQTSASASRLIVTGSAYLAKALTSGADSFTQKTKPNPKPMTFTPTTQARIRKINHFSEAAADLSAKAVGQVGKYAQNLGATLARRNETSKKGLDKNGNPIDVNPGILNKSLIAFSTLVDGIEQGARTVLSSSTVAASTMIGHHYGAEAGVVANHVTSGVKNVGLVYIDAAGVSRKAILNSVAKGMVVGRMRDGQQVVVSGGHGGLGAGKKQSYEFYGRRESGLVESPSPTPPPAYGASGTISLGGTPMSSRKY
ncbi:Senescence-associated domain containing protein [Elaphomyces granulatus]